MQVIQSIQNRIYEVRSIRVMLDFDVAALYQVDRATVQEVLHRLELPVEAVFKLTIAEWERIRPQVITLNKTAQNFNPVVATTDNLNDPPFACTAEGLLVLSGLLASTVAVQMHLSFIKNYTAILSVLHQNEADTDKLIKIKQQGEKHEPQLNSVYEALENLLDANAALKKWESRTRIGFR